MTRAHLFAGPAGRAAVLSLALAAHLPAHAGGGEAPPANSRYDPALAASVGADEHGMRSYVLVILKTGPSPLPKGPERDDMFRGHFANIQRLAGEGKLALAGPFGGNADGWRGLYVFATDNIEQARAWVATDPVVAKGEMVPDFHLYYGSAALMLVNDAHGKVARQPFP